jgi:hypothetical protein
MKNWQSGKSALLASLLMVTPLLLCAHVAAWSSHQSGDLSASLPQVSADAFVRSVVNNEIELVDSDHSHWMYRQHHVEEGKDTLKECVDTDQGALCRMLAEGGRPLSEAEQNKEKERLQELVRNPEHQRKLQQARKKDSDQALKMLKMLPNAFHYEYVGAEGNLLKLKFVPNPQFDPPDREARVFHAMVGFMWVDRNAKRLAELSGKLTRDVDFGFGLLGHLYRGGTFQVKRADVGDGHWETTLLDVKIHGKALFFKTINADERETTDNFAKAPGKLTMAQGVKLLEMPGQALEAKAASGGR